MCEEKKEHIRADPDKFYPGNGRGRMYPDLRLFFDVSNLTKVRPLFMLSHRCLTLNKGLTLVRLRFLLTNIIIYDLSF